MDACAKAASFCALTGNPEFSHFMAAVWEETDLRGLVYARQRKILGFPLGKLYVGIEDCQDGGVIAPERDRPDVLRIALRSLLPHPAIHTMTFTGDRAAAEHVCRVAGAMPGLSSILTPRDTNAILTLGESFDAFLRSLGKHTRRNLTYYRRRARANGWFHVERLSPRQLTVAIGQLVENQRTSCHTPHALETRCEMLETRRTPFWSGLRDPGGLWLALVGGWIEGEHAFVTCQLNHAAEEYRRASLSTVMRSYLAESLVARGARDLTFIGGCKGILRPFCKPLPCHIVTIQKQGPAFAFRRALLAGALNVHRESETLRAWLSKRGLGLPVSLDVRLFGAHWMSGLTTRSSRGARG